MNKSGSFKIHGETKLTGETFEGKGGGERERPMMNYFSYTVNGERKRRGE